MGTDKRRSGAPATDTASAMGMARGHPAGTATPIDAVLFDMDGVITNTAEAHALAWKRLFDEYLEERAKARGDEYRPFDIDTDYHQFVDGKPRYDGVRDFLGSRGITLPYGKSGDAPGAETICGLGNLKNNYFHAWLDSHKIKTFPDAERLIKTLRKAGVKIGVFSSSRNAQQVLTSAGVLDFFDTKVDGIDLERLRLPGKPDPAALLEAASRLNVSPRCTAVIEDAIAGVEAGARGGFGSVIGIDRGDYSTALKAAGATVVVRSLSELSLTSDRDLIVKMLSDLPLFFDQNGEARMLLSGKAPAVFLDYDGTLTPIVRDYTKAFLSDGMRAAIDELSKHCTVAIISGRDAEVVRSLVKIETIYYAGSHGFEIIGPKGWNDKLEKGVEFIPKIDEAEKRLRKRLVEVAGTAVERKRFSIAIHYRQAAETDVPYIESIVDDVLSEFRELRKGSGKKVFRVQPDIDWDKGRAILWLLQRLNLDRPDILPIYVGDDITDEDAFRALAGIGLTLIVRDPEDRPTAADYALADPDDVKRFLELLSASARANGNKIPSSLS